ncbi:unnamed protein product [Ilex paraguariensis]|uniref:Phosphatidic acid phosphatase type 2/haloperoxidase domain-containing protein n=1 Tax=Ilex paraguariensis TaxID=185542 RepID=A0ABC8S091_9AQUA
MGRMLVGLEMQFFDNCDFVRIMFYDQLGNAVCHGDKSMINKGHKSFPSGHTSWSFAGLGFLSLYLSGKIKAFDRRGHVAKLCIVLLPLLVASLVGISRVDDYMHHWEDVFAGAACPAVDVSLGMINLHRSSMVVVHFRIGNH